MREPRARLDLPLRHFVCHANHVPVFIRYTTTVGLTFTFFLLIALGVLVALIPRQLGQIFTCVGYGGLMLSLSPSPSLSLLLQCVCTPT